MKSVMALVLLLLAGCSGQPLPMSNLEQDWYEFGQQRAENGWLKQSSSTLAKRDSAGLLTPQLYLAYENGYANGQLAYCAQSAYMLGVTGKPYHGICDKQDPFFYQDYISGRHSTAGSMF
ncbi:DUF2799 domain-containing protein [Vibrio sp. JPW-9-11-11]|uniref:DUF2799 domain-containing protein n=1 Tax=Vibrio sp. JPW-9-11-11 TaxID=1416532 RepID=UPI001593A66C|nr:DUF2799 domain-containing protein [Vibrio sp. JPW-9-11-11]NVD07611.1 DUF2799 domain-containing protein [Vibrio sp. JPW-9-11-11]